MSYILFDKRDIYGPLRRSNPIYSLPADPIPNNEPRSWELPNLEQLGLLCLENSEVVKVEMDSEGILSPGQWAFSLNLQSQEFKTEMGGWWSGVTWRVVLGKEEDQNLWQLATGWGYCPGMYLWEVHKYQICRKASDAVGEVWYDAQSGHPRTLTKKPLVKDEDGKTWYLGP